MSLHGSKLCFNFQGCEEKFGLEKKDLENEVSCHQHMALYFQIFLEYHAIQLNHLFVLQLKMLSSENDRLMEQVEYLQSQLKVCLSICT